MQWEKGPAGNYLLVEDGKSLANVSINHGSSVFRISSPTTKRAFLLHKEGFWKNKIALKNEYGHKLGQLYPSKWHNGGILELEGKKFRYQFRNNPLVEIVILNETGTDELVVCGLQGEAGKAVGLRLSKPGELADADLQYILFALAWYMFLPIAQENIPAYGLLPTG